MQSSAVATMGQAAHVIHPTAVYSRDEASQVMRWKASTARREIREKRLRVCKRAGRYYILGEWLLEWIRAGEIGKAS